MQLYSSNLAKRVHDAMASHYPFIYIHGREENRIETTLQVIAKEELDERYNFISWSQFKGFSDTDDGRDSSEVFDRILATDKPTLFLLKDFPAMLDNSSSIRAVRDLYYALHDKPVYVFFSFPSIAVPDALRNQVYLISMHLPSEREVHAYVEEFVSSKGLAESVSDEILRRAVVAMIGLTLSEIEHMLTRMFSRQSDDPESLLLEVHDEKSQILQKEGCLQFIAPQKSLDQIGGLDELKDWIIKRQALFTEKAFQSGVPLPSGVLFMGVSGCGKSMAAKVIATAWNVPLVRLDMSLVLSGSYGPPESAFEHATRVAEDIAPIVLWIDELENSFGYDEQAPGKGNVNILSSFLTWMQDKSSKVFIAATANRIQQLPAELMRKGRFDQLFFLDLPNKNERIEIFKIHIQQQGGDVGNFDLGYLSVATKEWSGAEIEQSVKSARIEAYQEERIFTDMDLRAAVSKTVPLSQTMREQIKAIKDWSHNRAVPASSPG